MTLADNSHISWTTHTANFWHGCVKVSPLCDHCYAERNTVRWGRDFVKDRHFIKKIWNDIPRWERESVETGVRPRVFVMSMGDFFERLPEDHKDHSAMELARQRAMTVMEYSTNLDFLVLTKRISNVPKMVWPQWLNKWPSHIRLGISVGTQKDADRDIPRLLAIDAPNFLSMEPLLERVDPTRIGGDRFGWNRIDALNGLRYIRANVMEHGCEWETEPVRRIDWVITGGESGPQARPADTNWYRLLRDQCAEAGVPFHFKQNSEWCQKRDAPANFSFTAKPSHGYPETNQTVYRIGRKAAGHLLDGVEHFAFP